MSLPPRLLVWAASKPILKLFINISAGVILAKKGILKPANSKVISQILINLGYPTLLFASVATSFSAAKLKEMGILTFFAVCYVLIGTLFGYIIMKTMKPPIIMMYVIQVATSMGNWGDMTLAVVLSVGNQAPFQQGDALTGVAYVSAFLVFANLYFYIVGFARIGQDFVSVSTTDPSALPVAQNHPSTENTTLVTNHLLQDPAPSASGKEGPITPVEPSSNESHMISSQTQTPSKRVIASYQVARLLRNTFAVPSLLRKYLPEFLRHPGPRTKIWLNALANPSNFAVIFGLIIATIPQVKALFVSTSGPTTIENEPPLSFFMETCQFIGNFAVPLALINLGAALGRLSVKNIFSWPIILSISFTRLVLLPIFGIILVQLFTYHAPMVNSNDKMLRFVLMFQAAVPTASSTVFFTQFWHPLGEANEIAAVVLIQYILALFTLTGVLVFIFSLMLN